jgi:hypothetical protein
MGYYSPAAADSFPAACGERFVFNDGGLAGAAEDIFALVLCSARHGQGLPSPCQWARGGFQEIRCLQGEFWAFKTAKEQRYVSHNDLANELKDEVSYRQK